MNSKSGKTETDVELERPSRDGLAVTLYLRSGSSGSVERRQAALRDRFEAVRAADCLASASVERWSPTVVTPVSEADAGMADALDTYRELSTAVADAGGRLAPFFEVEERRGGLLIGRPEGERITFPVACLVVRREDAVTGVYPCWLDGTHHSLEEGLAALELGDPENLR
jgi:hypothetical protein